METLGAPESSGLSENAPRETDGVENVMSILGPIVYNTKRKICSGKCLRHLQETQLFLLKMFH